jgi:hypothetical protein
LNGKEIERRTTWNVARVEDRKCGILMGVVFYFAEMEDGKSQMENASRAIRLARRRVPVRWCLGVLAG